MLTSRRMLEAQLDWIGRRFRFVSLDELGAQLGGRARPAAPLAAVTFDDGYRDVYEHGVPRSCAGRASRPRCSWSRTWSARGQAQCTTGSTCCSRRASRAGRDPATRAARSPAGPRPPLPARRRTARAVIRAAPWRRCCAPCRAAAWTASPRRSRTLVGADGSAATGIAAARPGRCSREHDRGGRDRSAPTRGRTRWLTQEAPSDGARGGRAAPARRIERRLGVTVEHFAYPGRPLRRGDGRAVGRRRLPLRLHDLHPSRSAPPAADASPPDALGERLRRRRQPLLRRP